MLELDSETFFEVAIVLFSMRLVFVGAGVIHVNIHVVAYWVYDGFEFLITMDGPNFITISVVGASDDIHSLIETVLYSGGDGDII